MSDRIATPKNTIDIIKRYEFIFQKRFGQNFLIDQNIIDKIIEGADLTKEDVVIEIGPGIGSLTQALAENSKKVIAIEIDKKLIPILNETLKDYDNIIVINQDILKADLAQIIKEQNNGNPVKIVANLPYYITTPIIMGVYENKVPVKNITVMIQKEVADRILSGPGSKDYGALSLAVQYYSKPNIIANVGPHCFIPVPKVGSSVICLNTYQSPNITAKNEFYMFKIIKAAFNQRRKTLVNSLFNQEGLNIAKKDTEEVLIDMGLDNKIRGEAMSLSQFADFTNRILTKGI